MNENEIEMLLALNTAKSITHAAEILFINQSSLSKRLRQLEKKLEATLFVRSKQGITFTPEGEEALQAAKEIKNRLETLKGQISRSKDHLSGTLNLGCSLDYSLFKLPDILSRFQHLYPEIKMNITTDYSRTVYRKLLEDEIDAGIIRGEFHGPFRKELIATENIYLICASKKNREELQRLPFIGRKSDYHFQDEMTRWLSENDLYQLHSHTIQVDNMATCVEMVKRGIGWALVPQIALSHFDGYKQQLYFQDQQPFTRSTYLMYKPHALQLAPVRAFREVLSAPEAE